MTGRADAVIKVQHVALRRGGRDVLIDLSLAVGPGEIYALAGANGSGKSSTLALLLGFLRPDAGSITVAGIDPSRFADAARRHIAYLQENVALYNQLTARENIAYFMALAGEEPSADDIEAGLDAVGLQPEARAERVGRYSKGMRQKVAIAMAVLRKAPVVLLDEPTSGLDPQASAEFTRLLGALQARGAAVLMVTHDLLGAVDCADRLGFLVGGKIVEEVSPAGGLDIMALHRRISQGPAA